MGVIRAVGQEKKKKKENWACTRLRSLRGFCYVRTLLASCSRMVDKLQLGSALPEMRDVLGLVPRHAPKRPLFATTIESRPSILLLSFDRINKRYDGLALAKDVRDQRIRSPKHQAQPDPPFQQQARAPPYNSLPA